MKLSPAKSKSRLLYRVTPSSTCSKNALKISGRQKTSPASSLPSPTGRTSVSSFPTYSTYILGMTSTISSVAREGFSNASSYDQHRPSYAPEVVQQLLKHLQVDGLTAARVVDLAAGTGKFTELLAARKEGYEILAVEPQADMRKELAKKDLKGVKIMDGNAANMPIESQSVDAVVAAQVRLFCCCYESQRVTTGRYLGICTYNNRAFPGPIRRSIGM